MLFFNFLASPKKVSDVVSAVTDCSNDMTVESNYVIAIALLSDWLKRLAPVFQPTRSKTKTNRTMNA